RLVRERVERLSAHATRIRIEIMRKLLIVLAVLAAGCSRVPMIPGISAHKIEIQQGNYLTQDMVAKLKPGMTRSQVRYILGTPLLADPFHADRWDYVYQMQRKGETVEFRRIFVVFEQDKLARIEGDVVPSAAQPEAKPADRPAAANVQAPRAEEKSPAQQSSESAK
ncbi:MAG TPA: outer membrane protein assembly factor BamE, partial [Burkholderiales bacterium]|nr:outer membrane protein assembly factor BamE [Burkholderiales bacterium]